MDGEEEFKKVLKTLFSKEKKEEGEEFLNLKKAYLDVEKEVAFYKMQSEKMKEGIKRALDEVKNSHLEIETLKEHLEKASLEKRLLLLESEEKIQTLKKTSEKQKQLSQHEIEQLKNSFEEKIVLFEKERQKYTSFEEEKRHLVERLAECLSQIQRLKEETASDHQEEVLANFYSQLRGLKEKNNNLEKEIKKVLMVLAKKVRENALLKQKIHD